MSAPRTGDSGFTPSRWESRVAPSVEVKSLRSVARRPIRPTAVARSGRTSVGHSVASSEDVGVEGQTARRCEADREETRDERQRELVTAVGCPEPLIDVGDEDRADHVDDQQHGDERQQNADDQQNAADQLDPGRVVRGELKGAPILVKLALVPSSPKVWSFCQPCAMKMMPRITRAAKSPRLRSGTCCHLLRTMFAPCVVPIEHESTGPQSVYNLTRSRNQRYG